MLPCMSARDDANNNEGGYSRSMYDEVQGHVQGATMPSRRNGDYTTASSHYVGSCNRLPPSAPLFVSNIRSRFFFYLGFNFSCLFHHTLARL